MDPVTANSGTGANFNRYKYAANNPYRFTDPDGRLEDAERFVEQHRRDMEAKRAGKLPSQEARQYNGTLLKNLQLKQPQNC